MEHPENKETMTQTPASQPAETMTDAKEEKSVANMTDPRLTGMQNVRAPATTKETATGTEDAVMKVG